MAFEQLDLFVQGVGQGYIAAMVPERAVTLGVGVVQQQEIAHAPEFELEDPVVAVDIGRLEMAVGEELQQHGDAALDQVDAGGFQRLQEARRQPQRHAIFVPGLLAPAGGEAQRQRFGQRLAFEIGQQRLAAPSSSPMKRAAIDMAVADAVLQRNAPLPAGVRAVARV